METQIKTLIELSERHLYRKVFFILLQTANRHTPIFATLVQN